MIWDHHIREKLAFAAGVVLTAVMAALILGSFFTMPSALGASLRLADSRAVLSDSLGHNKYGYSFIFISFEPTASSRYPQWYWAYGPDKLLSCSLGSNNIAKHRFEENFVNGSDFRGVANPYSGMAAAGSARIWRYPYRTRLVLFDMALFEGDEPLCDFSVPSRLGAKVNYGYMHTGIIDSLEKIRRNSKYAQNVPHVIAASDSSEDVLQLQEYIRGYLKQRAVIITASKNTAAALAAKDSKVLLVGAKGKDTINLRHCVSGDEIPSKLQDWIK